ncbi:MULTISPECIES: hypothetical protein [unclassified Bartonella]|uniref:hypothetical protein n=1 Tax=unclassified Bartonella TaxID=2645622 RepID=UPI0035D00D38
MTHFTIQPLRLHCPPLLLNRPTTLTALNQPHILDFTVPRFYDFANSQKTSKPPINNPIEAYYKPINWHQPFSNRDQRKMRKIIHALLPSREAMG